MEGDTRCFGRIWDRHRDRVFRHLVASGSAAADAEDLAAIVFLELWRRRAAVRFVDESLLPWWIATAQNVHRNAARGARRYRAFLSALPEPDVVPDHAERYAELHDPQLVRLRALIASARPADARLLAMTVLEGFTIGQAAAAVGLKESAAKMRLKRFRARLTSGLEPHPVPDGGTS